MATVFELKNLFKAFGDNVIYEDMNLEVEEGEAQAAWIDANCGLAPMPITAAELPAGLTPTSEGWLRTHPGMLADQGGLDGFFVARWVKAKSNRHPGLDPGPLTSWLSDNAESGPGSSPG